MLNEWGVHHLHFKHEIQADGFVERNKQNPYLIFIIFRPAAAYILNVFTHDDWTNKEVVEISARNWPDEGLFLHLNGVLGPEQSISEQNHMKLRKAHINTPIEVDGKMFAGLGLSTAGTSSEVTMRTSRFRRILSAYCADENLIVSAMKSQASNWEHPISTRPIFELIEMQCELGYGFGFREKRSGATLWIG